MSEETNELQSNGAAMDSAEFEARLTEIFTKHKESKLKLIPRIVKEFKGHEGIVLEHLHNKYELGIIPEKPKKKSSHKEQTPAESAEKEVKPKSKKKLILIISVSVVVIGLGAAGFLLKDKILGKKGDAAKTEETTPATTQPGNEQPKEEAAPAAVATKDSAAAGTPDSGTTSPDTSKRE